MSTHDTRRKAVAAVAQSTGKPISAVLDAVAPSWGLDRFAKAQLEHDLRTRTPTPEQVTEHEQARAQAKAGAERYQADADANAVATFRHYHDLQKTNPFAAARLMAERSFEVQRGRALDTEPEPPNAA